VERKGEAERKRGKGREKETGKRGWDEEGREGNPVPDWEDGKVATYLSAFVFQSLHP